jgi:serine/threonine protein kinase
MVGQTISHYRILDKLGEGGMGVVYKAEDLKLKRIVALKFLTHGLDSHEPDQARFLREAQVASALNHPNVCTIHDIVQEQQKQFIVMEYVDGVLLREKISHKDGEPSCLQMDDVVSYAVHNWSSVGRSP